MRLRLTSSKAITTIFFCELQWAEGYATGEPGKRYEHWSSRGIWTGLLIQLAAATATAVSIALPAK